MPEPRPDGLASQTDKIFFIEDNRPDNPQNQDRNMLCGIVEEEAKETLEFSLNEILKDESMLKHQAKKMI